MAPIYRALYTVPAVAAVEGKPVRTASSPPILRNPNSTIVITGFVPPKSDEGLWQDRLS